MDCRILRQVTLKSDGHLGCDDSTGYGVNLGQVSLARGWRIDSILRSPIYRHVRSSFAEGRVPWPGICEGCDLLSDGGTGDDTLDHALDILVEPTLACPLSCACCLRKQIINQGRPIEFLDQRLLTALVNSCVNSNIRVGQIHYIGWGEPILHPDLGAMVTDAARRSPNTNQIVTTSGNGRDYVDCFADAPVNHVVVSCDGATSRSYQQYRRGGSFETVLAFMREGKRRGHPDTHIEWKYILFEFNDSDEEILEAQKVAADLGINSLTFVITNSKWKSPRYRNDNAAALPLAWPQAAVAPAAAMNAIRHETSFAPGDQRAMRPLIGHIDLCHVTEAGFLNVEGWAAFEDTGEAPARWDLLLDGALSASSTRGLRRTDVMMAHPGLSTDRCGFRFHTPMGWARLPLAIEVVPRRETGPSFALGGPVLWRVATPRTKARSDLV